MRFETKESLAEHLQETVEYSEVIHDKRDVITIRTKKIAILDEKVWMVKQRLRNDKLEAEYIIVHILACINGNWIDVKSFTEAHISYKNPYFLDCPTHFFSDKQNQISELWRSACRKGAKFKKGKLVFLGRKMRVVSDSPLILKDEDGKRVKINENLIKYVCQ